MLEELKRMYNHNLERYCNGCSYCEKHRNEIDKWLAELIYILNNMNNLLDEIMKYQKLNEKEVLEGFDV